MNFKSNQFHNQIHFSNKTLKDGSNYTVRSSRERYFFPDEWKCFYDSLKPKQQLTFGFLINTGARINEVSHVQVMDVDFERNNVVIRYTKSRNKDGSRRVRTIPISPQFARHLKRVVSSKGLVLGDTFKLLSTPAANIAMKKALQRAGIPDWKMFSVHNVRKTLETWLMGLGIDSMRVIKHFGHSFVMASKHYVSPDVFNWEDKRQIREIIGDLYLQGT